MPSKPSSSMPPPNGANITSPPGSPPWITTASEGGGGAASCAFANPGLNMKIPLRTILVHALRFIISSPLLSRTRENFSLQRFQLCASRLLRQPHRLRQSIIANEQIHLNPFVGSLFVNRQAQRAQR